MREEASVEARITRFLLDMNKLMDGIHVEETTEYDHPRPLIKFEAKLTCLYAIPGMWSPTKAFYTVLKKCCDKYFEPDTFERLGYNNTKTVFWLMDDR